MPIGIASTYVALWVIVVIQAAVIVAMVRAISQLRKLAIQGHTSEQHSPSIGAALPRLSLQEARSGQHLTEGIFSAFGGIALFTSPQCDTCRALVSGLKDAANVAPLPPVIVVCRGDASECAEVLSTVDARIPVVLDPVEDIASRLHVTGYPTALVFDEHKRLRTFGHPQDLRDLTELVTREDEHQRNHVVSAEPPVTEHMR